MNNYKNYLNGNDFSGELLEEVKRFDGELIQTLINTNRKCLLAEFTPLLLSATHKEELDRLVASVVSGEEIVF